MANSRGRLPSIAYVDPEYWRRKLPAASAEPVLCSTHRPILKALREGWLIEHRYYVDVRTDRHGIHTARWRYSLCKDGKRRKLKERVFRRLVAAEEIVCLETNSVCAVWGPPSAQEPFDWSRVWRCFRGKN